MNKSDFPIPENKPFDVDLDALLHPALAFKNPREVVNDPDLTLNEKRAILASWASDACAVEAAPTLRCAAAASEVSVCPGQRRLVNETYRYARARARSGVGHHSGILGVFTQRLNNERTELARRWPFRSLGKA
jgi:hypothetical protein